MANAALLADYLFLQELIEARVRGQLGQDVPVMPVDEMAQVTEANLSRDTVFVLWDGERFPDDAGGGSSTMVTQRYTLLLAKKNARQAKGARNESAGPLLARLHKALAGWTPEGAMRPFRRANGRQPNYRASVALYPLTFSINLTL
ncbi:MAG: hypothetical protein KF796_20825 [Ramlibacter sp.]|nr:hypothetical protein [Ramlibacter sp.]